MVFGGLAKLTLIDYPGKTACMVFTIGCNMRCPYCHNPELVEETVGTKISEREVFDFLDSRREKLDGVVVTGGEPTMHEDLPRVLKEIKRRGYLVKLDSNGTRPEVLRNAIADGVVDYIAMDIKAPLRKYDEVAARPVDTEAIRTSIKLLMSSSIEYEFRTTVVKSMLSPDDIEQIGKEIRGAKRFYLQRFVPGTTLHPRFDQATYSDDELERFKRTLQRHVETCGIR